MIVPGFSCEKLGRWLASQLMCNETEYELIRDNLSGPYSSNQLRRQDTCQTRLPSVQWLA